MVEVTLLGIAQDGGRPQAGCTRPCCQGLSPSDAAFPVALGITDGDANHLIEATRCLGQQLTIWGQTSIDNVFLTHAHFGHVDGLGLFGKETMNAKNVGLYISSEMEHLVDRTPQWSLMVDQGVFAPSVFHDGDLIQLSSDLTIQPLKVPIAMNYQTCTRLFFAGQIVRCFSYQITTHGGKPSPATMPQPFAHG